MRNERIKKAHAIIMDLFILSFPVLDEFRDFLASEEGSILSDQARHFIPTAS